MDALALLCNLYGEGPATLKRLRSHGVRNIDDLGGRSVDDCARLLSVSAAQARRFLKEAAQIEHRVLERKPKVAAPAAASPSTSRSRSRRVQRTMKGQIAAAARRWSREAAPVLEPVATPSVAPLAAPAPAATPWSGEGLDDTTRGGLVRAGVTCFEDLIRGDVDELCAASGLSISQVLFAQGLARRRMRDSGQIAAAPAPVEAESLPVHVLRPGAAQAQRFSPSERPPREFLSQAPSSARPGATAEEANESAGPFA